MPIQDQEQRQCCLSGTILQPYALQGTYEVVVHSSHGSSVGRVSQLDSIGWSSGRSNASTEAKHETTSNEMALSVGSCLNGGTNNDQNAAHEDTDSSTVAVGKETTEWEGSDLSAVVDDEDNSSAAAGAAEAEGLLVGRHGVDSTHEGRVETVHRRHKVTDSHLRGR